MLDCTKITFIYLHLPTLLYTILISDCTKMKPKSNNQGEKTEDMEVEDEDAVEDIDGFLAAISKVQVPGSLKGGEKGEMSQGKGESMGGKGFDNATIHYVEAKTRSTGAKVPEGNANQDKDLSAGSAPDNSVVTVDSSGITYRKRKGSLTRKKGKKKEKREYVFREFRVDYKKKKAFIGL